MFGLENSANNFGRSAGLLANTTALRPVEAAEGTIYVDVQTLLIYRYDAITTNTWQQINGGGGAITGAFNGCQEQANEIGLGGVLSEATVIETENFPITFSSGATTTPQFGVISDAAVSELAVFTSLLAFNDGGVYIGNFETFGTIQSKEYAGQTPTELRINYDGGNIQLGNGDLGMYFDFDAPVIKTTYQNNEIGLELDFANNIYKFGDFDFNLNFGTSIFIDDLNSTIVTKNTGSERGLKLSFLNNEFSFGDFDGINNGNSIKIFDANDIISIYSNQGFYNFANIPSYANNAAAISSGLSVGDIYRGTTGGGDTLHIVH